MTIERTALAAAKSTHPRTSMLNPAWVYVPANKTADDGVLARWRREQELLRQQAQGVVQINREKGAKVR